jgi:hypothetical protein
MEWNDPAESLTVYGVIIVSLVIYRQSKDGANGQLQSVNKRNG